jgi:hypothetical protein
MVKAKAIEKLKPIVIDGKGISEDEWAQKWFKLFQYLPSKEQWGAHSSEERVKLICGGERAGKSKSGGTHLAMRAPLGHLYWICALSYDMTKPEFDYVVDCFRTAEMKLGVRLIDSVHWSDRDKSSISLNSGHILIETKSLRDWLKVASVSPDGIVVCEADQLDWQTIERLLMRLTESQGWAWLSGTYESSLGWMAEKWKEWQGPNEFSARSFSIPTWSNLAQFPGGRQDPKLQQWERVLPADKFMERYGGVPCPPSGLIIPEFRTRFHVKDLQIDKHLPVHVAVDPGFAGAYAVEFIQIVDGTINVVDEIYVRSLITSGVIQLIKQKPYCQYITGGVADIAATQHQAMPSVVEQWAEQPYVEAGTNALKGGMGIYLQTARVPKMDGIERIRTYFKIDPLLEHPRIQIDPKCKGLISELGGCKGPFEDSGPWLYRKDKAGHVLEPEERNNHACTALIYFVVNHFGYTRDPQRNKKIKATKWYAYS